MHRIFMGLVGVAILGTVSAADEEATKADLKNIEGTWQLVSAIKDGVETPTDVVQKIRIVIKDSKHTVFFGDDTIVKEIPFTIDPTKNPKTTVDKLPEGKEIKGIYKIDGDKLTSCVGEVGKDHPSDFASKPGSGWTLRVFKRVKT